MAVDVVVAVAVAGHFPSTTSTATATATATAIPPDDCPVWVRGSIMEYPAIPRGSAVSSCLPRDYGEQSLSGNSGPQGRVAARGWAGFVSEFVCATRKARAAGRARSR